MKGSQHTLRDYVISKHGASSHVHSETHMNGTMASELWEPKWYCTVSRQLVHVLQWWRHMHVITACSDFYQLNLIILFSFRHLHYSTQLYDVMLHMMVSLIQYACQKQVRGAVSGQQHRRNYKNCWQILVSHKNKINKI